MRVLCLIKQVCEPETRFDLVEGRAVLCPPVRRRMGLYSEYALETGLALTEQEGGEVTALTLFPGDARDVLVRAAGMGAKRCVQLLCDERTAGRPFDKAALAAAWADGQGFDLILTGVMSEDAMHGVLGPAMAEIMDLPLATSVVGLRGIGPSGRLSAVREMEGGRQQEVALPLPAVVSVQSSPGQPRYPSLSRLLAAKKNPPRAVPAPEAAPRPADELFLKAVMPQKTRAGVMLSGDAGEKAAALLTALRERALL